MRVYGGKGKRNSKKKMTKNKKKIIIAVFLVLLAVALTITALAVKYVKPPAPVDEKKLDSAPTDVSQQNDVVVSGDEINIDDNAHKKDFFTVLIVGTDNEGWNTDTIMLAAFDVATKKANVMSIPRDTMVNVKRSNKKINAAYSVGGKAGNMDELLDEVKSVIGFRPDKYALVSLKGFIDMIDAIGGVTVDVPIDMNYSDPGQNLTIHIKKGRKTLNGYDSMGFMRYRHTYVEGDIGRIKVQQTFVKALMQKMLTPSTMSKLPQLADIVMKNVKTDLTTGNIIWLGKEALSLNTDTDVKIYTLPGEAQYYKRISYYVPYKNATLEIVNECFNPYVSPIKRLNIIQLDNLSNDTKTSTKKTNKTIKSNQSSAHKPKAESENTDQTIKKAQQEKTVLPQPEKEKSKKTTTIQESAENKVKEQLPQEVPGEKETSVHDPKTSETTKSDAQ